MIKKLPISFLLFAIGYLLLAKSPVLAYIPPEPEIIELRNSPACSDFEINQESVTVLELTPTPNGGQVQGIAAGEIEGNLTMKSGQIFDLSKLENNLSLALTRLLPAADQESLSVDDHPLGSFAKHYISGKESGQSTKAEKPAESKITYPSWWTKLISESRIFCSLFGDCPAPKSLNIQVADNTPKAPSEKVACVSGINTASNQKIIANTPSADASYFKTRSVWDEVIEYFEGLIDNIWKKLKLTKKTPQLTDKTVTNLTGGQNFVKYSKFMESWLPAEFLPKNKTATVETSEAVYEVALSPGKDYSENLKFQNQGRALASYCLQLCSLNPAGTNISRIDPVCTSCKADDYRLNQDLNDFISDTTGCNPDVNNACDYVDHSAGPSCTGDPICESGKCYPLMYRQAKDYLDHGCVVPYAQTAPDCFTSAVCQKLTLSPNSAGGFGNCRYQNSTVCVRTDRSTCADLCNWACCSGQ